MTKTILDVCCGGRMFYFDKQNKNVVYCDMRNEDISLYGREIKIRPDVQCDFTKLPFTDNVFNMVIFDPPQFKKVRSKSFMLAQYGKLPKNWKDEITNGFKECMRVLKCGGTLIFKWNDTDIRIPSLLSCFPQLPLLGQRTTKNLKTHWFVFYKV